ncbi:helix-turn-helix transcriptional regulator [Pedobacter frigidisoli]|uniref:helix-turn-helix transcriptional regulator n=1 Tax=Pedobacter frigidisoli TaxID=2530455 RepID=UPI002931160E|nr:helix-turn-helix transcriptional regulator [Pedobacter frigidisoli]
MIQTYKIEDFPSNNNIDNLFAIERFEDITWPIDLTWPHKHNFYQIIWVTDGTPTYTIDYQDITIKTDTLLITSPGQIHLSKSLKKIKGYCISFTEEFLLTHQMLDSVFELTFLEDSFSKPYLCLNDGAKEELTAIIGPIIKELNREVKVPLIINGLVLVLLNRIQRLMNQTHPMLSNAYHVLIHKKFKKLIEQYYSNESDLHFYADKLGISPNYLNRIVKNLKGKTAGIMIRERGLTEAKRMLVYCNLPIGDISERLGFKDFSYFSRQFKKQEGISPAEYRRMMYKKYL